MFSEFTGQAKVRERLELMVEAAKKRGDVLEHILLSGPSGLGKTTLAYIIATRMGVNVKNTSGPVIEKAGELAGLLTSLEKGDVLFIDEIIGSNRQSKNIFIRRWKIIASTSLSIRAHKPESAIATAEVHAGRRNHAGRKW